MTALAKAALEAPAGPRLGASELADVVLASLFARGGAVAWFDPVSSGEHREAHRISIERGRQVLASATLEGGLGDAVLARLALLGGVDLLSPSSGAGRCRVRVGEREREILIAVRSAGGTLAGEVRVLDERGEEAGGTTAALPDGGAYPEHLEPGTTVGPYRVEALLGRGGMGVVYQVEHTFLRKSFAMKVLLKEALEEDPDSARRFVREARAAARVRDEGIVDVSDFGTLSDGRTYLVMELLSGCSLEDVVLGEGALDPDRAVSLVRQIARALRAAHGAGVVHRDLTPSNVFLLGGEDRIKLVDFGAAQVPDPESADVPDGPPGFVVGTPYYMSPEQARGHETDARTDVYSLGVILFELLAGRPPFEGEGTREIVLKHVTEPAPVVESPGWSLSPDLQRIVARCLEKDPDRRYQAAGALLEELDRAHTLLRRKGWRKWLPA